jgi:hypothetical protein
MISEHDEKVLLRCRRLGHEIHFSYCRQEQAGKPCRMILNCWFDTFDVREFLSANLPVESMAELESLQGSAPKPKMLSLLELIEQAKQRVADSSKPKNSDNQTKSE